MKPVTLGEAADINPKGPVSGELSSDAIMDFLPMTDVSEHGTMKVVQRRPYSEVAKGYTAFQNDDVLVAKITPCFENNKIALAEVSTPYAFGSTEFHVVRAKPSHLHPRYLLHFLRQDVVRESGEKRMTGSAGQRRVPRSFLEELEIPLPPLEEQKRIAAILDQADALRRLRARAHGRLNALGQAIFHEMKEELSAGDEVGIEAIADIQIGYPFKSINYVEGKSGILLCRGANVLPGKIDWSNNARYPAHLLKDVELYRLCEGDIVLAMDRPWISSGFKVAQLHSQDLPAYLVQRVARFRAKRSQDKAFLHNLISSLDFQKHCRPTETTVPHISPREIREFQFRLPPEKTRDKFSSLLEGIKSSTGTLEGFLNKSEALFSSLQHRAFRGEL